MQTPDQLKQTIDSSGAPDSVKAQAWDAFTQSKDPSELKSRLDKVLLPNEAKAKLWDMKASAGGGSGIPKDDPLNGMINSDFLRNKPREESRRLMTARSKYFAGLPASKQDEILDTLPGPPEEKPGVASRVAEGLGQGFKGILYDTPMAVVSAVTDEPTEAEKSRAERHPNLFGTPERGIGLTVDRLLLDPQLAEYNKAKESFKSGKFSEGSGHGGAALLPMLGPMAAHFGERLGKGEWAESLGEAGAYAIAGLFTKKLTKDVEPYKRLTAAAGGGASDFEKLMGDLAETARRNGKRPKSPQELYELVNQTGRELETDFNRALQPFAGMQMAPIEVADALRKEADKFDSHTPEGRAAKQYLMKRAVDYQKQWTLGELNTKRMKMFDAGLEAKTQVKQMGAVRNSVETLADKTIENSLRDLVYDTMEKRYKGAVNFKLLKEKQSRLLDLKDRMEKRVEEIKDQQAKWETAGPLKKAGLYIRGHVSGITPAIHPKLEGAPEKAASKQIKKAFRRAKPEARQEIPNVPGPTPGMPAPPGRGPMQPPPGRRAQAAAAGAGPANPPSPPPAGAKPPVKPQVKPATPPVTKPPSPGGSGYAVKAHVAAPLNFTKGETPGYATLNLSKDGSLVGRMDIGANHYAGVDKAVEVKNVRIPEELQNKGHGTAFYHEAAKYAKEQGADYLISDTKREAPAEAMWKSLQKKYPDAVTYVDGRWRWDLRETKVDPSGITKDGKVTVNVEDKTHVVTLTESQKAEWRRAHEAYQEALKRADRLNDKPAAVKAAGMRWAAEKRRITGKHTAKERENKAAYEATNYKGKNVAVKGKPATVIGTVFGKITVKMEDGSIRRVNPEDIKEPKK